MNLERLQRQLVFIAPAVVMSAWGTVMLHTLLVGHINRLLSPMFRSYVGIAAVALFVLSALHLLLYRPSPERVPGAARQLGRWLVLLVPVIAASVLSPAALSNTTAQLRSSGTAGVAPMPSMKDASARDVKEAANTDPNQPAPVEVTDLVDISRTPELIPKFEGRQVHVVGLYTAADPAKLTRWVMWCCAADAAPASVTMIGQLGGPWKDQEWLDITGVAHFPTTMGQVIPQVEVTQAKATSEPDEPFLSP
jgi:uncharacterized repeat protein (TIGR03943 family)